MKGGAEETHLRSEVLQMFLLRYQLTADENAALASADIDLPFFEVNFGPNTQLFPTNPRPNTAASAQPVVWTCSRLDLVSGGADMSKHPFEPDCKRVLVSC
jgi:hypothetical protein